MVRGPPEWKRGTYQDEQGTGAGPSYSAPSSVTSRSLGPRSHPFPVRFPCLCPTIPLAVHSPQPNSSPPSLASIRSPLLAANERLPLRFHFRFYQCVSVTRATTQGSTVSLSLLPFRAELLPPTPCGYMVSFCSCGLNRDSIKCNWQTRLHLSVILPSPCFTPWVFLASATQGQRGEWATAQPGAHAATRTPRAWLKEGPYRAAVRSSSIQDSQDDGPGAPTTWHSQSSLNLPQRSPEDPQECTSL